jgi:hypothetical protein
VDDAHRSRPCRLLGRTPRGLGGPAAAPRALAAASAR